MEVVNMVCFKDHTWSTKSSIMMMTMTPFGFFIDLPIAEYEEPEWFNEQNAL